MTSMVGDLRKIAVAVFAALALALTLAPPAHASYISLRTWNRLAQCESSGRWHINTGNGYYGGLQISHATWKAYGGLRYARNAHRASKRHQIRIAHRIKHGQGWGAWPVCSRRIGLR